MGRSSGKKLSLVKPRNILLGGATGSFSQEVLPNPVIVGDLKKLIVSRLSNKLTRKEFYQDLTLPLRELDAEEILKDPTFLKILFKENEFLNQETDKSLSEKELKDLAKRFIFDLNNHSIPNLGRVIFTDRANSNQFRRNFLNSYLFKLNSIVDRKEYVQFALEAVLPLAESKKDYQAIVIDALTDKLTSLVSSTSEVETSLDFIDPGLKDFLKRDEIYKMNHTIKAALLSSRFYTNQLTVSDIEEKMSLAKKSAFLQAVFSQLLADELIPGSGVKSTKDLSKHEQIDFLNQLIDSGVHSGDILTRVYELISHESEMDSKAIEITFKKKEINGEAIYDLLSDLSSLSGPCLTRQSRPNYKSSLINLFINSTS